MYYKSDWVYYLVLYAGIVMHRMRAPSTAGHVLYTNYWLRFALQQSGALVWNFVSFVKNTPKEAIHALVGHYNALSPRFRWGRARNAKRANIAVSGDQNFTLHQNQLFLRIMQKIEEWHSRNLKQVLGFSLICLSWCLKYNLCKHN